MYTISFPGGVKVDAVIGNHVVHTDQPPPLGSGSAVSPFELLFVSIGTCMGFYALRFCQKRDIPTDDLSLTLEPVSDDEMTHVRSVRVTIGLPAEFPERYVEAIRRAVDQCSVKRHLLDPPEFEVSLRRSAA